MRSVHQDEPTREQELVLDLDEIARRGARKMLAQALEAEVEAYLKAAEGERDECGRALVVKNGYARSREIVCGAGAIEVRAPRVNDKRVDGASGERKRFKSVILPPYMRRSPKISQRCALVLSPRFDRGLTASLYTDLCSYNALRQPPSKGGFNLYEYRCKRDFQHAGSWDQGHIGICLGDGPKFQILVGRL